MLSQLEKEARAEQARSFGPDSFALLDCLVELRPEDARSGVQFRDCLIDYTTCPNGRCIKKLV